MTALRVISLRRSNLVGFEVKRTLQRKWEHGGLVKMVARRGTVRSRATRQRDAQKYGENGLKTGLHRPGTRRRKDLAGAENQVKLGGFCGCNLTTSRY